VHFGADLDDLNKGQCRYPLEIERGIFQAVSRLDCAHALSKLAEFFSHISMFSCGQQEFVHKPLYIFTIELMRFRAENGLENEEKGMECIGDPLILYRWGQKEIQNIVDELKNIKKACSENLIAQAVRYISENYNKLITLEDISKWG